jgi:alpha-beta hydrolase superfamily lysophospholipase
MPVPKSNVLKINLQTIEPDRNLLATDHSEYYWRTNDNTTLYSQTWLPAQPPRAVINIIHSLGEHSSCYSAWAGKFTGLGFIVRSFDLRGHGRSEGKRGYSKSYQQLITDVTEFIRKGNEEFENLPVFIYGQSLGGNLALNYAIQRPVNFKGMIVTSPWFKLMNEPGHMKTILAKRLSDFFPGIMVSSGFKPEDLSRELRVIYDYRNDPLTHDRISLRLATEIMEAGIKASVSIYKINAPLLVMHGNCDRITSCTASRNFVLNAGKATKYIEWEGGFHELHMDIDREKVFAAIIEWIERHI